MPRPIKSANGEPLNHRFQMMLTKSEVEAIDDWMFANRVRSRADAMRQLIGAQLELYDMQQRLAWKFHKAAEALQIKAET